MDHSKFPKLEIKESLIIDDKLHLQINFMSGNKWVGEKEWIFIIINEGELISGDLCNVDLKAMTGTFISSIDYEDATFVESKVYSYLDYYWGERAFIVLSTEFKWVETVFVPNLKYRDDHDECHVCWATIPSEKSSFYMQSYFNDRLLPQLMGPPRICMNCYKNYVLKKDLSFIVIDKL
jgi:hypothetical protein